jgi:hypothetical protein
MSAATLALCELDQFLLVKLVSFTVLKGDNIVLFAEILVFGGIHCPDVGLKAGVSRNS